MASPPQWSKANAVCAHGLALSLAKSSGSGSSTTAASKSSVACVAFTADEQGGQLLASGWSDSTVRLWDVVSGQAGPVLRGHTDWVMCVAFSPEDSRVIASGSADHTVRLWLCDTSLSPSSSSAVLLTSPVSLSSATESQTLMVLQGNTNVVRSVCFSLDGLHVAAGSLDSTVRLWDTTNGHTIAIMRGHSGGVLSTTFFAESMQILSGSQDKTVRVWEPTRNPIALQGHTDCVTSVAASQDGHLVASGSIDKTIRVWQLVVAGCADKTVRFFDGNSGAAGLTLKGHTAPLTGVAMSPNGRVLATSSEDGTVRLHYTDIFEALYAFACAGDAKTVKQLLVAKPNVNTIYKGGWTLLHVASYFGHEGVIKELLAAGADPSISNKNGKTAAQIAADQAHDNAVALLTKKLLSLGKGASL